MGTASDKRTAHIEWLTDSIGLLRVFAPGKHFGDIWQFGVVVRFDTRWSLHTAEIMLAQRAPKTSEWRAIRAILRRHSIQHVSWTRHRPGGETDVRSVDI